MTNMTDALYLDHAATTDAHPEVVDVVAKAMTDTNANASGLHGPARAAKNAMEEAREEAASLLGVGRPLDIVFTSGGTEADNLAIGGIRVGDRRTVVTTAIEHEAVLESVEARRRRGDEVRIVGVDVEGRVSPADLVDHIDPSVGLVSVMAANNETGVIQPVPEIADQVKQVDPNVLVHTDAVQAFATQPVDLATMDVDALSLAAHKFGGPKGVGLLAVRSAIAIDPVLHGGGQEAGRRSGTYNVPGIVGMVTAMRITVRDRDANAERLKAERDEFERIVTSAYPDAVVTGAGADRLVSHSHIHFPGTLAETLLIRLDTEGIAAAAGSACQSGAVEPSHVLTAMGFDDIAAGECIRFSFGWSSPAGIGTDAAKRVVAVLEQVR